MSNFDKIKERIIRADTQEAIPTVQPIAYILGGQPGAGKTTLQKLLRKRYSGNIIEINGDKYRKFHPEFESLISKYGADYVDHTAEFASNMTEQLINDLSSKGYNLTIEGTLRKANVPIKTAEILKSKGYRVELSIIAVKPTLSYLSTKLRYEKGKAGNGEARRTAPDHHNLVVNNIVSNLKELESTNIFENITIYSRFKELLYDKQTMAKMPAHEVLHNILFGDWTQQEIENLKDTVEQIEKLLKERNAIELPAFQKMKEIYFKETMKKGSSITILPSKKR